MELRNAENQTDVLVTSYRSFRRFAVCPPPPSPPSPPAAFSSTTTAAAATAAADDDETHDHVGSSPRTNNNTSEEIALFHTATMLPSWNTMLHSVMTSESSTSSTCTCDTTDATDIKEEAMPVATMSILDQPNDDDNDNDNDNDGPILQVTARELLTQLHDFTTKVQSLESLMMKFRQRMNTKDPVTQQPRYGENTMKRVVTLLQTYNALQLALQSIVQSSLMTLMEEWVKMEEITRDNQIRQEEYKSLQQREIQERQERELQVMMQQEALREELRLKKEREELAARAEKARLQRIKEQEEAKRQVRQSEKDYIASIPKGIEGVKKMLHRLRSSCEGRKKDLDVALNSLHTLFSQIASNPEEVQFRRVRRDHPRFMEDIGRHDGGKEVLIAAGFVFAEVDGVDCFFSKEPDLEHDMDAWSEWFDVIRGTIAAVEEEMIKG
mmetsp:Transcript_16409/g.31090  ORF Transcript_16409/g.31090 Transcript_16409/m.31090 type:complete len:440 (+) Transcript_16409:157-1476(+)